MADLSIDYRFEFDDAEGWSYRLVLDPKSLEQRRPPPSAIPRWADLDFHQCSNCPLSPVGNAHCPAALSLVDLVERTATLTSHDQVSVTVQTPERTVTTTTTLQRGLSSLAGLVLATSGCPRAAFFKPMARFHLPLADEDETIYRATSMYLLAQYFLHRDGRPVDLELDGLSGIYGALQTVNRALAERLRAACEQDAAVNAVILLDAFAKAMSLSIREHLTELRHLFGPYLRS